MPQIGPGCDPTDSPGAGMRLCRIHRESHQWLPRRRSEGRTAGPRCPAAGRAPPGQQGRPGAVQGPLTQSSAGRRTVASGPGSPRPGVRDGPPASGRARGRAPRQLGKTVFTVGLAKSNHLWY
eukprot:752136-Hanusia_phi.AAC.2